jgi:hypothetical protein
MKVQRDFNEFNGRDSFKSCIKSYINNFQEVMRKCIQVVFKLMKKKLKNYSNYTKTIPCNDSICRNSSYMN